MLISRIGPYPTENNHDVGGRNVQQLVRRKAYSRLVGEYKMADKAAAKIKDLQRKPYNKVCFDCGQKVMKTARVTVRSAVASPAA